jgi:hypothetical protein
VNQAHFHELTVNHGEFDGMNKKDSFKGLNACREDIELPKRYEENQEWIVISF